MAQTNPDLYLYLLTPAGNLYKRKPENSPENYNQSFKIRGGYASNPDAVKFLSDHPWASQIQFR